MWFQIELPAATEVAEVQIDSRRRFRSGAAAADAAPELDAAGFRRPAPAVGATRSATRRGAGQLHGAVVDGRHGVDAGGAGRRPDDNDRDGVRADQGQVHPNHRDRTGQEQRAMGDRSLTGLSRWRWQVKHGMCQLLPLEAVA